MADEKFAYIEKKQYLCSVKITKYINIILICICVILAKLLIIRLLLEIVM